MGDCRNKLIYGRVEVEIKGRNMERFLNISSNRSLLIEQVESNRFMTSPSDFKRMKDVARKTGVHLRIIGRHGLPFFLYRNRMRKLLQIGVVIFLFGLYLSSFFIWDISYEGNRRFTDEMLDGYLETIPIYHGIKKIRSGGILCTFFGSSCKKDCHTGNGVLSLITFLPKEETT